MLSIRRWTKTWVGVSCTRLFYKAKVGPTHFLQFFQSSLGIITKHERENGEDWDQQPAPERREGGIGSALDGEHDAGGDRRQLEVGLKVGL